MLNLVFIKIFQEQIKRTFFECINYILPHWVTLFFFLWVYHFSLISAYFCNPYYSYSDVVCLMSISEFFEDRLQANWSLLQKKKKLKWRLYKVNQSKEKSILLSRDCIRTPLERLVPSTWYLWFLLQRETCFQNLKWWKETYLKEYSLLSELWVKLYEPAAF